MATLLIYDNEGYVIQQITGSYRIPVGIPYLEVEVPEGKTIANGIGVNVSVTPHQVILEDIPPSETEILKQDLTDTQIALAELTEIILGGM